MHRILKNKFPTQEKLNSYLFDHLNKDKNGSVSLQDLQDLVISTCSEELEL